MDIHLRHVIFDLCPWGCGSVEARSQGCTGKCVASLVRAMKGSRPSHEARGPKHIPSLRTPNPSVCALSYYVMGFQPMTLVADFEPVRRTIVDDAQLAVCSSLLCVYLQVMYGQR